MTISPDGRESVAPTVAVLMAVRGADDANHFEEALQSVCRQTYPALQIWLFADGPLERAHEEVIARCLSPGITARIIRSGSSVGLPAALNQLIDDALKRDTVQYLARMDADDVCLPTRIEEQVRFLEQHTKISLVGTWCIEFSEPGVPLFHKRLPVDSAAVPRFMLYRCPLVHPTVMFHRRVFAAGYRYNSEYLQMQDYELWSRLVIAGYQIANIPEYLLWFRMAKNFYARRTGWRRGWREVRLRLHYARRAKLLRPQHLIGLGALLLLRVMPVRVKRLAYLRFR